MISRAEPKDEGSGGLERLLVVRLAVVITLVGVAALPTAYTLDPGLATRSGFWQSNRWLVGIIWAVFVSGVGWWLAAIRDSESRLSSEDFKAVRDGLNRLESKLKHADQTLSKLDGVTRSLQTEVAATQHSLRRDSTHARVERLATQLIKTSEYFSAAVLTSISGEESSIEYPQELAESSSDMRQAIQQAASFSTALRKRDVVASPVSVQVAHRLPISLRKYRAVYCVPIYNSRAVPTGCLSLWIADSFVVRDQGARAQAANECRNLAEDICAAIPDLGSP